MDELEILSPSRIESVLELACAYNAPLTVTIETESEVCRYKSRMLEMKKKNSHRSLVIDHPVTDGPAVALKQGTPLTLFFAMDEGRFVLETTILRKTTFTLENRRKISAFEITYPNSLKKGQRRTYFRVPVHIDKPILVEGFAIEDDTNLFNHAAGTWNFPAENQIEGHAVNISVGGILLALDTKPVDPPDVGTQFMLRFSMTTHETPLVLKAIVRRIEEETSSKKKRIGYEFKDSETKFEYKLAINRLYKFVAERQREIIKSG